MLGEPHAMSSRRALKLVLPPSHLPLFQQIAQAITAEIQSGRLPRGTRLPGTRALSEQLSVHRSTVEAAFEELRLQAWLESTPGSGTYVSQNAPLAAVLSARPSRPSMPGFDFPPLPPIEEQSNLERGILRFGGAPDVRVMPIDQVARAYRHAQNRRGRDAGQSDPRGHEGLRVAVAEMLRTERGMTVTPDEVLIVSRATHAVELVMRSLVQPGDAVAVEALGFRPVRDILERNQARVLPVELDAQGLRVDALEALAEQTPLRAVWVTPHCQYPTTVVLSDARRAALRALALRHRFAIIESDYLHDFHYADDNPLPLASRDDSGHVVYLGSLARILAPDVQLGYVVAPLSFLEVLARRKQRWGDRDDGFAHQLAVAELLEDGEYQRSRRRALAVYRERRDLLVRTLRAKLGNVLRFDVPASGTALWASVAKEVDVEQWAARAMTHKVQFRTGKHFAHDRMPRPFARFGFTQLDETQLVEAVDRLALALKE